MSVDAQALRAAVDFSAVSHVHVRGAYFDAQWVREGGFSDSVATSSLVAPRAQSAGTFEIVHRLTVPCDRYHLAMTIEEPGARARGVYRRDADATRFVADNLAMSDVLLFRDDGALSSPAGVSPSDAVISRGGATMRPNVARRYAGGERVRAYVEIYNLALATRANIRESAYDLRFAIFPADDDDETAWVDWGRRAAEWAGFGDDDAAISQTFRRAGRAHDDHESMAIDIDVLDPGCYELVIEVADRLSGARAIVHARFWKESSRVAESRRRR
jgi:hypothetical protein